MKNKFKLGFLFCFLVFVYSCKCKREYIEPNKIVDLNSKEINALNETLYIVTDIKGSLDIVEKLKFLKNQDFDFKSDKTIFSNGKQVGSWDDDRWVHIDKVEMKFLINLVSREKMNINSEYIECNSDSLIKESIYLKGNNSNDSEFNRGNDF